MNGTRIIIEPGRTAGQYWRDLWRFRELLYFLAWRDVVVRYKQTAIGVAWAVLRPLLTMIIFTFVFGKLAKLPSEGVPYPVLVFAALLPWQLFANALSESGNSLVGNANLISKVYFPRLVVPVSAVLAGLVDFLITTLLLLGMMAWYDVWPTWRIATLPAFILFALAAATGVGVYLSALNVRYRDFRYIIPFVVQFGLYISPVGFSSTVVPEEWRWLYALNPMVGVIDGFRWALLGVEPYWPGVAVSAVTSGVLLAVGLWYFRKTERYFADII